MAGCSKCNIELVGSGGGGATEMVVHGGYGVRREGVGV